MRDHGSAISSHTAMVSESYALATQSHERRSMAIGIWVERMVVSGWAEARVAAAVARVAFREARCSSAWRMNEEMAMASAVLVGGSGEGGGGGGGGRVGGGMGGGRHGGEAGDGGGDSGGGGEGGGAGGGGGDGGGGDGGGGKGGGG